MVRITNTLGGGGRPWTTNTPPLYSINVGGDYPSLTVNDDRKRLLVHELAPCVAGPVLGHLYAQFGGASSLECDQQRRRCGVGVLLYRGETLENVQRRTAGKHRGTLVHASQSLL